MVRRLALCVTLILCFGAPPPALAQDAVAQGSETKVWIGHWAEYEEYLRTAPIDRIEDVGQGVTKPERAFFSPGGLAASAIVKILPRKRQRGFWEAYKSEVAAYELDRILGLDMVPVTVERRIKGDRASVQLWVEGTKLLSEVGSETPKHPVNWVRQVRRHRVFDALIANIDRNAGNMLIDEDWNLILIDHSRAFMKNDTPFLDKITAIDRPIYEAMKALDEATLNERLKPWLFGKGSVKDLLKRRDKIVKKLEKLTEKLPEGAVFPP